MTRPTAPSPDPRDALDLRDALLARAGGYVPEWAAGAAGLDDGIVRIAASYVQTILRRLDRSLDKNELAFLDMMGIQLIPPRSARAPIVFTLASDAMNSRVPQGTRVAAPPPPGRKDQVIFETERAIGLAAARLTQVFSLWPGRDRYIDHSQAVVDGKPFRPFDSAALKTTPHEIYIAHDTLLALSGRSTLDVMIELVEGSEQALDLEWEYWDGKVWRQFRSARRECDETTAKKLDSTEGLQHGGTVRLEADCTESEMTTINGIKAHWIRARLKGALAAPETLVDPCRTEVPTLAGGLARLPEIESIRLRSAVVQPPCCTSAGTHRVRYRSVDDGQAFQVCDPIVPNCPDHAVGATAFAEDGILVSLQPYFSGVGALPVYGSCQVKASTPSGIGQGVVLSKCGLRFDFAALYGAASKVTVAFACSDTSKPMNLAVNDELVRVVSFAKADRPVLSDIGKGVQLEVRASYSKAGGVEKVTGTLQFLGMQSSLLLSGEKLEVGAIEAQMPCGIVPDKAFADRLDLDVTKTFYPLGAAPQPGSAFYFTSEEAFTKPGARVKLFMQRARTPQDEFASLLSARTALLHLVVWEYWNGSAWTGMFQSTTIGSPVGDLNTSEVLELIVPSDMAVTSVNGEDALWMRARLVSGAFGWSGKLASGTQMTPTTLPTPPAVSEFRLCYTWQYGPEYPQHVLTHNDFAYVDQTDAARWPGRTFRPFVPVADETAALYLGFDRALPVDQVALYFDIPEERGRAEGPALVWEYWNGGDWLGLAGVTDETNRLHLPGLVSFIGPMDGAELPRFGSRLHWVRARLKEDGPPGAPGIDRVYSNAVWAAQQQTVLDEPLGAATGKTNQALTFRRIPVLEDQEIDVRELAGRRANVEWRILALGLFRGDERRVRALEDLLASETAPAEIVQGDLRLKRDRQKRVSEVWVRWHERPHLLLSGPDDRHYVLERSLGRLSFGDGEHGQVPPVGAAVLARRYRTGGGLAGNVAAQAISHVLGAVGAVEAAFNPRPAEGGADGEPVEAVLTRGPETLRHRGRALGARDFETLAREASASVALARAIPGRDPAGRRSPGWLTLVIVPRSAEPRPWPPFGLRERVRRHVSQYAEATVVAASGIYVTGPEYVPVDVDATIAVGDATDAGVVEGRAREAIAAFLHPLTGGTQGRGWQPGRSVYLSDLAAVLGRVAGVDYVYDLALLKDGVVLGPRAQVPENGTVVAGRIRLKLLASGA